MFGKHCCETLCTVFKDDFIFVYQTLSFLLLEQCNQLSLSDEIGCTFFNIDDSHIFFPHNDNLLITWKNADISAIDNVFDNIALWFWLVFFYLAKCLFNAMLYLFTGILRLLFWKPDFGGNLSKKVIESRYIGHFLIIGQIIVIDFTLP